MTTKKNMLVGFFIGAVIVSLLYCFCFNNDLELRQSLTDGMAYKILKNSPDPTISTDLMSKINGFIIDLIRYLKTLNFSPGSESDNIRKRLLNFYDPNALRENNPTDLKFTSYVLDKGTEIAFCLLDKKTQKFHDFNTIKFVVLHELSHLACDGYGHGPDFWRIFKIILIHAKNAGLYDPENFAEKNIEYCGVSVSYNPYFDKNL